MILATIPASILLLVLQASPADRSPLLPKAGCVMRVGTFGSGPAAEPQLDGDFWQCGRCQIEAPLPVGYPAPTPPGAIEIKAYPSVRRAEFTSAGNSGAGSFGAFWPLFNHIKEREIAMTSPVEMDYREMTRETDGLLDDRKGNWTMSFLYREAELGPVGKDGQIAVVDTKPVTVLSVGLKGAYGMKRTNEGLRLLREWLDAHPGWTVVGEPRQFSYNGPAIRNADKWSEVHLPVALAAAK